MTSLPERTREATPEQARADGQALAAQGWRVITLPDGIPDGTSLLEALRVHIPLDPPMVSFEHYDALRDSVSGGLWDLGPGPVAIVWAEPETMRERSPSDFAAAVSILGDSTLVGGEPEAPSEVLFILGGEHPLGPTRRFGQIPDSGDIARR